MSTTPSTCIITGGGGFVGSNLAAALAARFPRTHLVIVDPMRSGSFANILEAFERKEAGEFRGEVIARGVEAIRPEELISRRGSCVFFHLGAITDTTLSDEAEMIRVNAESFEPVALACMAARVPLVYASSAATYGNGPQGGAHKPWPTDAAGRPSNVYGFSKWLMESTHRRLAARAGKTPPRIVGLRYFNVFGPGETRKGSMASMAYQLTTQLLAGKRPRLFRDGEQARDQVYVDDIVDLTLTAGGLGQKRTKVVPGVYNAGSGRATSFNQILQAIRRALGITDQERPTDYFEMPPAIRAFYQSYTCADMSRTNKGLGWSPRHDPVKATEAYAAFLAKAR